MTQSRRGRLPAGDCEKITQLKGTNSQNQVSVFALFSSLLDTFAVSLSFFCTLHLHFPFILVGYRNKRTTWGSRCSRGVHFTSAAAAAAAATTTGAHHLQLFFFHPFSFSIPFAFFQTFPSPSVSEAISIASPSMGYFFPSLFEIVLLRVTTVTRTNYCHDITLLGKD